MSENNTTEIEKIFRQYGGYDIDDIDPGNSSSDFGNSSDNTMSSSDVGALYSPIASSSVPWDSNN